MSGARRAGIAAAAGAAAYRLVTSGALTLDLGVGRRLQPLGPLVRTIAAPHEVVFDVIAAPYLERTPRALKRHSRALRTRPSAARERNSHSRLAAVRKPVDSTLRPRAIGSLRLGHALVDSFGGPVPDTLNVTLKR